MATSQTQRPQYFENQYLGAADLTAAVEYARLQQARHALGAHTWGIAAGLQLLEKPSSSGGGQIDLFIQPGFAWDGFGRPVVVLAPYKLSTEKFQPIPFDAAVDAGPTPGRLVEVWLRYVESPTGATAPGFEVCDASGHFSRVDELFQVEVGERPLLKDQRDPLSVAGRTADARDVPKLFDPPAPFLYDDSVAYQSFPAPEGRPRRWLIPLGSVRWVPEQPGLPGHFHPRTAEDKVKSRAQRRYAGVVGESVSAADGRIRLRDRGKDYSAYQSEDLVWVEGHLRVEGHARLFGGALKLLDQSGKDNHVPLTVGRLEANDKNGRSLQAQIGTAQAGENRFEVGPVIGNKLEARLAVLDSGRVGIGTTAPDQLLTLQGAGDAFLSLKTASGARELLLGATNDGGIVSTKTNHDLQLRAGGDVTKVLIRADGNVGVGTTSPLNSLHVSRPGHLNAIFENTQFSEHLTLVAGGAGSGLRFSETNFFFIGSQPYADRNSNDAGTELLRMTAGGNVGLGTSSPAARLDVNGRILRHGQSFSIVNGNASLPTDDDHVVSDGAFITAPFGTTTTDWCLFVSPHSMGKEELASGAESDNALLMIRCFARVWSLTQWRVTAEFKFRGANVDGQWESGKANWLLVPR